MVQRSQRLQPRLVVQPQTQIHPNLIGAWVAGGVARDNECAGNSTYGLYVEPSAHPTLEHTDVYDNASRDVLDERP
jgi:hypothetical protein